MYKRMIPADAFHRQPALHDAGQPGYGRGLAERAERQPGSASLDERYSAAMQLSAALRAVLAMCPPAELASQPKEEGGERDESSWSSWQSEEELMAVID